MSKVLRIIGLQLRETPALPECAAVLLRPNVVTVRRRAGILALEFAGLSPERPLSSRCSTTDDPETNKSGGEQGKGARLGNGSRSPPEFDLRNVERSQVNVRTRERDAIKRRGRHYSVEHERTGIEGCAVRGDTAHRCGKNVSSGILIHIDEHADVKYRRWKRNGDAIAPEEVVLAGTLLTTETETADTVELIGNDAIQKGGEGTGSGRKVVGQSVEHAAVCDRLPIGTGRVGFGGQAACRGVESG